MAQAVTRSFSGLFRNKSAVQLVVFVRREQHSLLLVR